MRPTASCELDQQSLVTGGAYLLGQYGVVSSGIGAGRSDGGPGVLGELAYEYDGRRFNFGARTRYTSDNFRQAGGDEDAARIDQLSLGLDFGRMGPSRHAAGCIATGVTPMMPPPLPPPIA